MRFRIVMQSIRQWFLLVLCCLVQLAVCLPGAEAADASLQAIPPLTGPVIDLTNTLTADQQQVLSQKLRMFHDKYGAQMQVLVIPTSAPEDAFTYSMRVVEQWKLGSKEKDDGLLLFIAKDDHRSQIQVGYGLEGSIPDVVAHRLLDDELAPHLRQGDFYGGINAVIDGVYAKVSGDASLAPTEPVSQQGKFRQNEDHFFFQMLIIVIVGAIAVKILQLIIGSFLAGMIGAPLALVLAWLLLGIPFMLALVVAWFVAMFGLMPGDVWLAIFARGYGGRGYGGGLGGGGGWSGGGGGFGGGGAGGSW
jgi:uncharacterized protein